MALDLGNCVELLKHLSHCEVLLWRFGFEKGGINEQANHLTPHIRTLSKYLGVELIYEVASEYQEFADERHEKSLRDAASSIEKLAAHLSNQQKANPC